MDPAQVEPDRPQLRSGVVTLLAASTLGVVMLSPAITLYGNFAAAFAGAGKAAPLAFVLALLATLPTAASYALLARDRPASGSAAAWTQAALGPAIARWVGLMVVLYYVTNFVLQPVTFGLFFGDLVQSFGFSLGAHGLVPYAIGAVLCCALPAILVFRGVAPSMHGALAVLVFEMLVVIALCISSAMQHPGGPLDLEGFHPRSAPGGSSGLLQGMVFALLSFCGFDVVSTLAEEAKMPRRMIPQATFVSLLSFGGLIIGGIWCLTFSAPPDVLRALAAADGMPIASIARALWGNWALLVTLTGISAALGISIATSVGASRVLFSMAREGLLPKAFAKLHAKYQVPWAGLALVFAFGLFGALAAAIFLGPWRAYLWWGTTSTFFAMITFLFVNLSNLALNHARGREGAGAFLLYIALPIVGVATDLYLLVRSFFIEAWAQGLLGQSAVIFDLLCALICVPLIFSGARSQEKKATAL